MECELSDQAFVLKMLKTIRANYAKAPFFLSTIDELTRTMETSAATGRLVELNCAIISWMADKLNVKTPMIRASTIDAGGERGEHLAAICERVEADSYLSPAGASDYLIEDKNSFDCRGISVWIQKYEHPEYIQRFAPFIPYASALDLIFNVGPDASDVMRSGRGSSIALVDINKKTDVFK